MSRTVRWGMNSPVKDWNGRWLTQLLRGKRMMRLRWLALLIVSVVALSACSSSPGTGTSGGGTKGAASKEPIKIGLAMALTGSGALTGEVAAGGTRLAVQHINAAGGINGRPIQLLEEDISDNNTAAVNALNRLIANGAVAVIGPTTSNPSAAMVPIIAKEQIPTVFRGITVDLKPAGGWAFRFAPHGQWQTAAMVRYLVEEKGYKKIAILHLNDEYGKSTAADAIKALKSYNLDPVLVEQWSGTDKDFTPQLSKVRTANPDAVIQLGVGSTVPQLVKQRYAMGLKQTFMTTTVITNQKTLELFTDDEVN
ncbi:MAG: receptor family ligand binding region, partial [Firmicutes bacterium]|nr:receptor family ligand binding region [Bacillota bacterium]